MEILVEGKARDHADSRETGSLQDCHAGGQNSSRTWNDHCLESMVRAEVMRQDLTCC